MLIYVDIDGTICNTINSDYGLSEPIVENINKINKLYDQGHTIYYWTARGQKSSIDWTNLTRTQLQSWNCKYHKIIMNNKPSYDLLICDKTKRIEEL